MNEESLIQIKSTIKNNTSQQKFKKITAHEKFEGRHKLWSPQNHVHLEFFKNIYAGPYGFSPKFVWRIRAVRRFRIQVENCMQYAGRVNHRDSPYKLWRKTIRTCINIFEKFQMHVILGTPKFMPPHEFFMCKKLCWSV